MKNIINHIHINNNISTSGQPTIKEFEKISLAGYEYIINLAAFNSQEKLENEDFIVSSLGMKYIHMPVDFENPTLKNLEDFINILQFLSDKKIWVHCIMNYRVSAFMYVYHKYILKTPFNNINLRIFDEWKPSKKWQKIIKTRIDDLSIQ